MVKVTVKTSVVADHLSFIYFRTLPKTAAPDTSVLMVTKKKQKGRKIFNHGL